MISTLHCFPAVFSAHCFQIDSHIFLAWNFFYSWKITVYMLILFLDGNDAVFERFHHSFSCWISTDNTSQYSFYGTSGIVDAQISLASHCTVLSLIINLFAHLPLDYCFRPELIIFLLCYFIFIELRSTSFLYKFFKLFS